MDHNDIMKAAVTQAGRRRQIKADATVDRVLHKYRRLRNLIGIQHLRKHVDSKIVEPKQITGETE